MAKGLPNAFYTDPAMFDTEKQRIFHGGWAAVAFGKDIPETGDVKPVQLLGMPILAVRTKEGGSKPFKIPAGTAG